MNQQVKQFLILTAGGLFLALVVFPIVWWGLKAVLVTAMWSVLILALATAPVVLIRGAFSEPNHRMSK